MLMLAMVLVILAAVVGSASMSAVLYVIFGRLRTLESTTGSKSLPHDLQALRDDLEIVRRELEEVREQSRFTERLVSKQVLSGRSANVEAQHPEEIEEGPTD